VGWGKGRECFAVEYGTIWGDPRGTDVWEKLDSAVYNREFSYGDGAKTKVGRMFVDSGGHATQDVYRYVKIRSPRCFAIKGQGGLGLPIIKHTSFNNKDRVPLIILGVDTVKEEILTRLRVEQHGPGFCHFPRLADGNSARGYDTEYFKGLTSERRATKFLKGFKKFEWIKKNTQGNEPFDCRVYATAALQHANVDLEKLERPKAGDKPPEPIKFGTVDKEALEKQAVVEKFQQQKGITPKPSFRPRWGSK
jgi:phage terminase large subunit GpA-like protein